MYVTVETPINHNPDNCPITTQNPGPLEQFRDKWLINAVTIKMRNRPPGKELNPDMIDSLASSVASGIKQSLCRTMFNHNSISHEEARDLEYEYKYELNFLRAIQSMQNRGIADDDILTIIKRDWVK